MYNTVVSGGVKSIINKKCIIRGRGGVLLIAGGELGGKYMDLDIFIIIAWALKALVLILLLVGL